MSRQTFIFVGAQARDADLMHLMEQTLDGTFTFEEGTDPYIRAGTVAVYVGEHDFDDDDIAWPGGSDVPLRSMYPTMIEFRDTGGDQQRQQPEEQVEPEDAAPVPRADDGAADHRAERER